MSYRLRLTIMSFNGFPDEVLELIKKLKNNHYEEVKKAINCYDELLTRCEPVGKDNTIVNELNKTWEAIEEDVNNGFNLMYLRDNYLFFNGLANAYNCDLNNLMTFVILHDVLFLHYYDNINKLKEIKKNIRKVGKILEIPEELILKLNIFIGN